MHTWKWWIRDRAHWNQIINWIGSILNIEKRKKITHLHNAHSDRYTMTMTTTVRLLFPTKYKYTHTRARIHSDRSFVFVKRYCRWNKNKFCGSICCKRTYTSTQGKKRGKEWVGAIEWDRRVHKCEHATYYLLLTLWRYRKVMQLHTNWRYTVAAWYTHILRHVWTHLLNSNSDGFDSVYFICY